MPEQRDARATRSLVFTSARRARHAMEGDRLMSSYRSVVVGTDGSTPSLRAVTKAAAVAADTSATLVIVCAYYPSSDREVEQAQDELGGEAFQAVSYTHLTLPTNREV